jgi:hypothetical protein
MIMIVKIRVRKLRTDTGKYSFVNRTIKLWNQLPAEGLASFHSKPNIFRKRVRKVITSGGSEGILKGGDETSKSGGKRKIRMKCNEMR